MMRLLTVVMFVLLAQVSPVVTMLHGQSASLAGSVLLDGKETPLANAEIQIAKLNLSVRSDSLGKFNLLGVPVGKHTVLVRLVGHEPVTIEWEFKSTQPGEADFILKPNVTKLSEVKVKDTKTTGPWAIKLADFDERRAMGIGKFLTADYFESKDGRPVSSFLAERIAGSKFIRKNGRSYIASTRGGGKSVCTGYECLPGACYMQVVVNGITRWNGSGQQMFDIDELNSKDIIGFEFYTTATTPLQYNGTRGAQADACGTIIIWTKGG